MKPWMLCLWLASGLSFSAACAETPPDAAAYIPLGQLVQAGAISVTITAKGGHSGDCMVMGLYNNTAVTQRIKLEPGRRLHAKDPGDQDILLAKTRYILLDAHKTVQANAYGFCCQASHHAPLTGATYTLGEMANPDWVSLARIIDTANFPAGTAQQAVWVLSDHKDITSIDDPDPGVMMQVRQAVAGIQKVTLPWYYLTYASDSKVPGGKRPVRLVARIPYQLDAPAEVSVEVRNQAGQLVAILLGGVSRNAGEYTADLDLDISKWNGGEYAFNVLEGDYHLNLQKKLVI